MLLSHIRNEKTPSSQMMNQLWTSEMLKLLRTGINFICYKLYEYEDPNSGAEKKLTYGIPKITSVETRDMVNILVDNILDSLKQR